MSGRSQNCGCRASGNKVRMEGLSYNSYYPDKENISVPSRRYPEALPVSRTRVVRERVVEETSTNMMLRSTKYSKTVSHQTTYNFQTIAQENARIAAKPSARTLRLPLTDVNEKYSTQVQQRQPYLIASTAKRPTNSNITSNTMRRLALDASGASSIRSTSSKGSQRSVPSTAGRITLPTASSTQLSIASSRNPYSTINDSDISFPTSEQFRNVTLDSSTASFSTTDDLRSFYSVLSNDNTWLTCKTENEDTFMSVPYKDNAKYLTSRSPSPFPDRSEYNQIIHEGLPSLRKKTLKREVCKPSGYKGVVNVDPHKEKVHPLLLYSDYIIEIIENLLINQVKHMLEPYFITNFNVKSVHRAAVINWLIKLQQYLGSDPCVLFMAVRLFDKMLSLVEIPPDMLQLVGLATYWISSKYSDIIDPPLATKLLQLCNNAYTVQELWKIENKVLRYLHFEIVVDEPIIFVRYYIYLMQLDDSNIVSICSNYLLDCLLLDNECNVYPISFQAAAAVVLSLRLLNIDVRLWNIVEAYPGYHAPEQMRMLQAKILYIVNLVQDTNYAFREPYNKYTTEKYASISLKLSNILSAL